MENSFELSLKQKMLQVINGAIECGVDVDIINENYIKVYLSEEAALDTEVSLIKNDYILLDRDQLLIKYKSLSVSFKEDVKEFIDLVLFIINYEKENVFEENKKQRQKEEQELENYLKKYN